MDRRCHASQSLSVLSPSSDGVFVRQSILYLIPGEAFLLEILLFLPVVLTLLLCLALLVVRLALLGQQPAQLVWQLSIVLFDDLRISADQAWTQRLLCVCLSSEAAATAVAGVTAESRCSIAIAKPSLLHRFSETCVVRCCDDG